MHLDVVRHFFPVEFIKKYIDYLALHKLNYFHWHLTDDQAWRVEMKCRPELTAKGSVREGEIEGLYPGKYRPLPYGGYYTHEDVREIVQYAAERYITVIPEIDIPGHCMAVLATYPQFSTTPDEPKKCALTWGIFNKFNNVLAPKPEVFDFLKDVFSELCDLFPGQYIHAGGDECAKRWWQEYRGNADSSCATMAWLTRKPCKSYFIRYVQDVVECQRKNMLVGWDEDVGRRHIRGLHCHELAPSGLWRESAENRTPYHICLLVVVVFQYERKPYTIRDRTERTFVIGESV